LPLISIPAPSLRAISGSEISLNSFLFQSFFESGLCFEFTMDKEEFSSAARDQGCRETATSRHDRHCALKESIISTLCTQHMVFPNNLIGEIPFLILEPRLPSAQ
jgi:uncharacterized protein (DUF1786 family)